MRHIVIFGRELPVVSEIIKRLTTENTSFSIITNVNHLNDIVDSSILNRLVVGIINDGSTLLPIGLADIIIDVAGSAHETTEKINQIANYLKWVPADTIIASRGQVAKFNQSIIEGKPLQMATLGQRDAAIKWIDMKHV